MNKKGIGMGPAIVVSVILLSVFFLMTSLSLSTGKTSIVKSVNVDSNKLEVNEILFDVLNVKDGKLNLADLIVLKEYDKVETILNQNLPDMGWDFRVYGSDFKNIIQSQPVYALENGDLDSGAEEFIALQNIRNYFDEELSIYLMIK